MAYVEDLVMRAYTDLCAADPSFGHRMTPKDWDDLYSGARASLMAEWARDALDIDDDDWLNPFGG